MRRVQLLCSAVQWRGHSLVVCLDAFEQWCVSMYLWCVSMWCVSMYLVWCLDVSHRRCVSMHLSRDMQRVWRIVTLLYNSNLKDVLSLPALPCCLSGRLCDAAPHPTPPPPWRQPRGKSMVSLVNSHTNATRIGWHLWEKLT